MKKLLKHLDDRLLFYLTALLLLFIPLYPKLPAVDIKNTWVSIRLEDFIIAGTLIVFIVQVLRKKARIFLPLTIPITTYWIIGGISLVACLLFIAPQLPNFFPNVAILSYFRRIEYMALFLIGFAAVKSEKDLKKLFIVLCAGLLGVFVYGLGQRHYINAWSLFPDFFRNFPFCFPSFQTTNEEFAKGLPLCLPMDGRITSLFGGHYDLSAYLVLVLPLIFVVFAFTKKLSHRLIIGGLGVGLIYLLVLTASRISFAAYLVSIVLSFIFVKKKFLVIPVLLVSFLFLLTSSSGVLERFAQTLRFTNIIVNDKGEIVGETLPSLPEDLKNRISKESVVLDAPPPSQKLPTGTSYISLPGSQSTTSALISRSTKLTESEKDRYKFGAVEISNVTGNFLVKRALVYDISFTTRFQGEWPVSWAAFLRNPLTGSGYSSITLSSDNSFLRALGETGLLGFLSYFSFFLVWFVFIKNSLKGLPTFTKVFALGLSAGIIGLSINGLMIDVFEASKVAESMWLLLGISAGAVAISATEKIDYLEKIKGILSSHLFLMIYLLLFFFLYLGSVFDNYFVADDFSWIKWAAQSNTSTLLRNFIDADGFFLRPIDKLVIFFEYTLFSLKPFAYHIFNVLFNFSASVASYCLFYAIFKKKRAAFLGALLFSFIPSHSQNLFWISTISTTLSSSFILFGLLAFYYARIKRKALLYVLSSILFLLSVFSYENAVIFIGLMVLFDLFLVNKRLVKTKIERVTPYIIGALIIGLYLGIRANSNAAGFSGDYNYNIAKLIPNIIGNYLGYAVMFVSGENFLWGYDLVRSSLKAYWLVLSMIGFLVIAFVGGFVIEHKEKIHFPNHVRLFLFGMLFSIVSLLPYLPLGNITLRYIYLASFGFILMILVVVHALYSRLLSSRNNLYAYVATCIIVGGLCYFGLLQAEKHWERASKITYHTLARFRVDYDLKRNTNVYFYNIPIRTGEAYIFPVGLLDAMHFVNDDPAVRYFKVADLAEAKRLAGEVSKGTRTYIFTFDKDFMLQEVEK